MPNLSLFCLLWFMIVLVSPVFGQQEEPLPRELGLRFSGFDDFNLMFKKRSPKGKYRRHRVLLGTFSYNSNNADYDVNFGYSFGVEKRKAITDKLTFISGPDLLMSFSYSNSDGIGGDRNTQIILGPALGYILGFNLDVSPAFSISAEVIPSIGGSIGLYDYSDNLYRVTAQVNSTSTALCLMYKF